HEEGGGEVTSTLQSPQLGDPTQARADRMAVRRSLVARVITHLCVIIGVVLSLYPFYWLVVMSTNTTAEIFDYPPKLTFGPHLVENVTKVMESINLFGALANTLFVSLACAVLVMFFDSLAAFAF